MAPTDPEPQTGHGTETGPERSSAVPSGSETVIVDDAHAEEGVDEVVGAELNGHKAGAPVLDGDGGRMGLFQHLAELRTRLMICVAAVLLTSIIGWFLYIPVLHFMTEPYRQFYATHKGLISSKLVITSPVEGFMTRLKIAMH